MANPELTAKAEQKVQEGLKVLSDLDLRTVPPAARALVKDARGTLADALKRFPKADPEPAKQKATL